MTSFDAIIERALREDIGEGDVTTECIMPADFPLRAEFITKEGGVIAGLNAAKRVFQILDPKVSFRMEVEDGASVLPKTLIATITGSGRAILAGERVALNFLQRLSGIATMASRYVRAVSGTKAAVLDTRKTAPGMRVLDKEAVRLGGASNHRFGLYDMVLIKENHVAAAGGSITEAVRRVRENDSRKRPIEVEVRDFEELRETLLLNVDRIMLDNMTILQLKEAVAMAAGSVPLEASGNITLDNVAEVAATGVDFISVGALTHSPKALDISLLLYGVEKAGRQEA